MARTAFQLKENQYYFCKGSDRIAEKFLIGSWDPTPDLDMSSEVNYFGDRIILFLENPEKPLINSISEWQFGISTTSCDILLGHLDTLGISRHHFCITITQEFCVKLRQQASCKTYVKHDQ